MEHAARESPFGGTIAHGYLTLSLLASLAMEVGLIPADASAGLNYGSRPRSNFLAGDKNPWDRNDR